MSAFYLAGLLKLYDLPEFYDHLLSWTMLPGFVIACLGVLVPAGELLLGGLFLAGICRQACAVATLVLLLGFSAAYVIQWQFWQRPSCGCLGGVSQYILLVERAPFVLGKNIIMALMVAPWLVMNASSKRCGRSGSHDASSS